MSQFDEKNNDLEVYKILFVGSERCGKTSLILHFINENFPSYCKSTVGFDVFLKTINLIQII